MHKTIFKSLFLLGAALAPSIAYCAENPSSNKQEITLNFKDLSTQKESSVLFTFVYSSPQRLTNLQAVAIAKHYVNVGKVIPGRDKNYTLYPMGPEIEIYEELYCVIL